VSLGLSAASDELYVIPSTSGEQTDQWTAPTDLVSNVSAILAG
jgi:hypothetical protein